LTSQPVPLRRKLIEVALPLEAINRESVQEGWIYKGNPSATHKWWAQRPFAAAGAVLFAQLVDDPISWPQEFPTTEKQARERRRLFGVIERLATWKLRPDTQVLDAARLEIARSHARASRSAKAKKILAKKVTPEVVNEYLATELPSVHDPFAGGGTIPLEAQRLGLRAIATDLNPVAILINKALIEIPPRFAGRPPVNPDARASNVAGTWTGIRGLAEDVRYYGAWIRQEARNRIGHLYPDVELPNDQGGGKADAIAWLWARTVPSPDPAFGGVHVPLVSSFWLSTKQGKETWLKPVVDPEAKAWRFDLATGKAPKSAVERKRISEGTKTGRGDFRCLLSGSPIPASYVREMGQAGKLGSRLLAIVVEGPRTRGYLPATPAAETASDVPVPDDAPSTVLPEQALGFRIQNYGMKRHRDLFTPRQLVALTTFSDLVAAARERVVADAIGAGASRGEPLCDGGCDADAYGDAVATYLAFAVDKTVEYCNSLVVWYSKEDRPKGVFTKQALPMVWDFAEINPLGEIGGTLSKSISIVADAIPCESGPLGRVLQLDAMTLDDSEPARIFSTDPPYYDNVPYADLSDFLYVWLRRSIRKIAPAECATILVPKDAELVAEPARHGGRDGAEAFFLRGMTTAMVRIRERAHPEYPIAVYYAFRQSESGDEGSRSTGWETFLEAVLAAGLTVDATWPVRSERPTRQRGVGSNALASSIVLVCRKRPLDEGSTTRAEFRRRMKRELPEALRLLQEGNLAPVDLPQAAIGPGMAIFSRHANVLEPDGRPVTVRTALQLINEALDEYFAEQEGDFDPYTRFGLTWYEQHRWDNRPFGEAENVAKARNIAVSGVAEAGFLVAKAGKVRLLKRAELPKEWDPLLDTKATIWEATQHLIKRLETEGGEKAAAHLLARLGPRAQPARDLAYRLYTLCERKKWADDALAYNALVVAWPQLQRLAEERPEPQQGVLL